MTCIWAGTHGLPGTVIDRMTIESPVDRWLFPAREGRVSCEQCHGARPHGDASIFAHHLNDHAEKVACQTCHIPTFAKATPTKMQWDWSDAGKEEGSQETMYGQPTFNRMKGTFEWGMNVRPTYAWYNGQHTRYDLGDPVAEDGLTYINQTLGHPGRSPGEDLPFQDPPCAADSGCRVWILDRAAPVRRVLEALRLERSGRGRHAGGRVGVQREVHIHRHGHVLGP